MTAPSREDLDRAIDTLAERLVRHSTGAGPLAAAAVPNASAMAVAAVSGCMSADALSLSALLAYRNNLDMDAREAKWAAEEAQSKIGGGK